MYDDDDKDAPRSWATFSMHGCVGPLFEEVGTRADCAMAETRVRHPDSTARTSQFRAS